MPQIINNMKKTVTIVFIFLSLISYSQITKNQEWIFEKKVTFNDSVRITTGAASGYVLTSDSRGIATWQETTSSTIQSATVTLDSADIVNIHTTPVEIVPAQGANTVIVPIEAVIWVEYNSSPYSTDVALRLSYDNNTTLLVNFGAVLDKTSDYYQMRSVQATTAFTGANFAENTNLAITTGLSNPTGGNSPVKITILYTVVNL